MYLSTKYAFNRFYLILKQLLITFQSPNLNNQIVMNAIKIKERFLSKKILCSLFGHKIITTRNVTDHFKEFKCTVCELELTNDEKGRKTFLTPELKEINETLIGFHNKKLHLV